MKAFIFTGIIERHRISLYTIEEHEYQAINKIYEYIAFDIGIELSEDTQKSLKNLVKAGISEATINGNNITPKHLESYKSISLDRFTEVISRNKGVNGYHFKECVEAYNKNPDSLKDDELGRAVKKLLGL